MSFTLVSEALTIVVILAFLPSVIRSHAKNKHFLNATAVTVLPLVALVFDARLPVT